MALRTKDQAFFPRTHPLIMGRFPTLFRNLFEIVSQEWRNCFAGMAKWFRKNGEMVSQ
jgi:hypothetical protein